MERGRIGEGRVRELSSRLCGQFRVKDLESFVACMLDCSALGRLVSRVKAESKLGYVLRGRLPLLHRLANQLKMRVGEAERFCLQHVANCLQKLRKLNGFHARGQASLLERGVWIELLGQLQ